MANANENIDRLIDYTGASAQEYLDEFTNRPQDMGSIEGLQKTLSDIGMFPGAGEPADLINALIYGAKGEPGMAALYGSGVGGYGAATIGSQWMKKASPKKVQEILSNLNKKSEIIMGEVNKIQSRMNDTIKKYMDSWQNKVVKDNVKKQLKKESIFRTAPKDDLLHKWKNFSSKQIDELPISELKQSNIIKSYINGLRREVVSKEPWRYDDAYLKLKTKRDVILKEIDPISIKNIKKEVIEKGDWFKEYIKTGKYGLPSGSDYPAMQKDFRKGIESLKSMRDELELAKPGSISDLISMFTRK